MFEDETVAAATAFIRELARETAPAYRPHEIDLVSKGTAVGQFGASKILLPGEDLPAKRFLEIELSALASRIGHLEDKTNIVRGQTLPDTPGEFGGPTSPFSVSGSTTAVRNGNATPVRQGSGSRNAYLSSLLAERGNGRLFSEEDLEPLREHVDKQAREIKNQKATIASVSEELLLQREETARTIVKVQNEDITMLQRELLKHQQANEAFQKALKEIGSIITNVANGDLSHKVQIHAVEMDPEITTFKRTINTMMDQLQVFGSEVSRVAREVGTEGNLGGQAQITGVSGIWKELTENGTCFPFFR